MLYNIFSADYRVEHGMKSAAVLICLIQATALAAANHPTSRPATRPATSRPAISKAEQKRVLETAKQLFTLRTQLRLAKRGSTKTDRNPTTRPMFSDQTEKDERITELSKQITELETNRKRILSGQPEIVAEKKPIPVPEKKLSADEIETIAMKHFGVNVIAERRGNYWFVCPVTYTPGRCENTGIYIHNKTGAVLPQLPAQEAEAIAKKHFKMPETARLFIETRGNYYFFSAPRFMSLFDSENGIYIQKQTRNVLTSRPASLDPP